MNPLSLSSSTSRFHLPQTSFISITTVVFPLLPSLQRKWKSAVLPWADLTGCRNSLWLLTIWARHKQEIAACQTGSWGAGQCERPRVQEVQCLRLIFCLCSPSCCPLWPCSWRSWSRAATAVSVSTPLSLWAARLSSSHCCCSCCWPHPSTPGWASTAGQSWWVSSQRTILSIALCSIATANQVWSLLCISPMR